MTDTAFVPSVTVLPATWCQDINNVVYRLLGTSTGPGGSAPADVLQILHNLGSGPVKGSIAELRVLSKTENSVCFVTGYYAEGDGGGGVYYYDAADSTTPDNGGTVIVATDGARWKLQQTGSPLSLRQFGAKGDGTTDDTTATQNWLNVGGWLVAPAGTYLITQALKLNSSNMVIQGVGRTATIFKFNFAGASGLLSGLQGVTELYNIQVSGIQFLDNAGLGKILDLTDMQFCRFERCWTYGFGNAGSIGVYMKSTNTTLQCTYNHLVEHYSGNVQYGVYMTDGANANNLFGGRFQSGVTGAIGVLLAPTAFNLVNGNLISGAGFEQPGTTMIGVQLNGNTGGTTISACRFEALLTGIVVQATDVGVVIVGPIMSGCTNTVLDVSKVAVILSARGGGVTPALTAASFNYNGVTNTVNKAINCTITKAATGQYQISGLPFAAATFSAGVSSSAPQTTVTVVDAHTVNIFTYTSAAVAVDAVILGNFWD